MKSSVERGESFTEALLRFNKGHNTGDIFLSEEGVTTLGPRIHKDAQFVKDWVDSKGTFTEVEQAHLDAIEPPPKRVITPEARELGVGEGLSIAQREQLINMGPEERTSFIKTEQAALETHMSTLNESVRPHESMVRALVPGIGSLATGTLGGLGAHALVNAIDPDHKMNRLASEAVEGAAAGGITAGMMAAAGASVALGPEIVAASAAYLAGGESGRAITEAMERGGASQDTAEAVGSVSGGAIGGVVASAVGTSAAVGLSLLGGAELGSAIGVVGGPVGMALGAAVGATLGAVIGGIGYLFSRHD